MVRTTLRLSPHLLAEARKYASDTGRSLNGVIEEALREKLERARREPAPKLERLPIVHGELLIHPFDPKRGIEKQASRIDPEVETVGRGPVFKAR